MLAAPAPFPTLRIFCLRAFILFTILFIISFSFGYALIPDIGRYTHRLFEATVRWTATHIFHLQHPYTTELISDSTGFYIHVFNILVLSLLFALVWTISFRNIRSYERLLYFFTAFVRYYLSLQLFIYGFSKVFKVQFYLPEPNILYTPLGQLHRDILYWSTMGISRPYSIFLGITEVVAAFFLLFRRTAIAGTLFAAFILLNVVVINFAYDIDVKLLSCFLLLLALFLLAVYRGRWSPVWTNPREKWAYRFAKIIVVSFIILEGLWPYIRSGNFNDDRVTRPYFHGAYSVQTFILNHDTLPPLLTDTIRWKRVFFHRDGYMIVEKMNDDMWDDKMKYDTVRKQIYIIPYGSNIQIAFSYQIPEPSTLILEGELQQSNLKMILKKIDLQQLPLLKKEFHWTLDEINRQ